MRYDRVRDIYLEEPCYVDINAKVGKRATIRMYAYIGPKAVIAEGTEVLPCTYINEEFPKTKREKCNKEV